MYEVFFFKSQPKENNKMALGQALASTSDAFSLTTAQIFKKSCK